MKLFNPKGDILQLGAKRHEKGQRANEIFTKSESNQTFLCLFMHEVSNENFANFKKNKSSVNGTSL